MPLKRKAKKATLLNPKATNKNKNRPAKVTVTSTPMRGPRTKKGTRRATNPDYAFERGKGAPLKIQDDDVAIALIEQAGKIQCTHEEVAAFLGIGRTTLEEFFARRPDARERFQQAKELGKMSLRRRQYQSAQAGDTKMQIHLGKNWLGQHSGDVKHSGTIQHQHQHTVMGKLLDEIDDNMRRAEQAKVTALLPAPQTQG